MEPLLIIFSAVPRICATASATKNIDDEETLTKFKAFLAAATASSSDQKVMCIKGGLVCGFKVEFAMVNEL